MKLMQDLATLAEARGGEDEDADPPRARAIHLASLTMTKLADGLIDPKLVLPWLLGAAGAPGAVIGALVPVREAGALLPQVTLAPRVAAARLRWPYWAAGSAVQGVMAIAIAAAACLVGGATGGWIALGLLAVFALARAGCSVSHKDALARTVAKSRRGAVTGAAGSFAAALVLAFAAALSVGLIPLTVPAISAVVAGAGGLWLAAAAVFAALPEKPRPGTPRARTEPRALVRAFRDAPQLRRFVAARGLLTVTALAPPFVVMIAAAEGDRSLGDLGPLVIASAVAAIVSAYVWGRLSDRSSRRTLMAAGALAALVYAGVAASGLATGGIGGTLGAAAAILAGQIAYEGVRMGRKIHLTDMATDETRAAWTAASNTAIGAVLLAGGLFGLLADAAGPAAVLGIFAAIALAGSAVAASLGDVQGGSAAA